MFGRIGLGRRKRFGQDLLIGWLSKLNLMLVREASMLSLTHFAILVNVAE